MALKKTVHGEKLQIREAYSGVRAKRHFRVRDVFCPRCRAAPNRKCAWTAAELVGKYCIYTRRWWGLSPQEAERNAKKRNREGNWNHDERRARADHLTNIAPAPGRDSKKAAIYSLAVKSGVESRRTLQRFDHLPLFAPPGDDPEASTE